METFGSGEYLEIFILFDAPFHVCHYVVRIDTIKNTEKIVFSMLRVFTLSADNGFVRLYDDWIAVCFQFSISSTKSRKFLI